MSQMLLLERYIQNVKIQSVMDRVSDTVYQGWTQVHGFIFWIFSVFMNHWKLKKEENKDIDYSNLLSDDKQATVSDVTPTKSLSHQQNKIKKRRKSSTSSGNDKKSVKNVLVILPPKPKLFLSSAPSPITTSKKNNTSNGNNNEKREKRSPKQSLFLMKSHMLSWKQKLSNNNSQPSSPVSSSSSTISLPADETPKRSFLRRLSSSNNSVYSNSDNGSIHNTKCEPTSPSILKSISFKLKRRDSGGGSTVLEDKQKVVTMIEESGGGRSRLSLSNFRRKTLPDITIK